MDKVLLINKEKGYTSRDVVNVISKTFGERKVGHFGTLDPMATGLLVIVSNEVYEQIKDNGKVYVRFTKTERNWFGGTTTTYYVAEVNWDYLINGTAGNLNFRQQ